MNIVSRTITGILIIALGLFLFYLSLREDYWILIYAVPLIIIGFLIFLNKKEDEIEEIKSRQIDKTVNK